MHKKAHDAASFEKRGDLLIIRGMRISSRNLGLSGQCDVVEFHQDENGVSLQFAGSCSVIFSPLLLNMYHGPLLSAKRKVLNPGKHQIIFLTIHA